MLYANRIIIISPVHSNKYQSSLAITFLCVCVCWVLNPRAWPYCLVVNAAWQLFVFGGDQSAGQINCALTQYQAHNTQSPKYMLARFAPFLSLSLTLSGFGRSKSKLPTNEIYDPLITLWLCTTRIRIRAGIYVNVYVGPYVCVWCCWCVNFENQFAPLHQLYMYCMAGVWVVDVARARGDAARRRFTVSNYT